jgi:hypothetical protein
MTTPLRVAFYATIGSGRTCKEIMADWSSLLRGTPDRAQVAPVMQRVQSWQLPVFDMPEGQIDAWPRDVGLFWNLVFEIFLSFSCHNQ